MPADRFTNYLRTYRKRSCLSQDDVAFLLNTKKGAAVCRRERSRQTPNLPTLLAYEILFRTPVRALFGGLHRDVAQKLRHRVRLLIRRLTDEKPSPLITRKLKYLNAILEEGMIADQI
jgi:DNA-binding XRE family transcriptional regulator